MQKLIWLAAIILILTSCSTPSVPRLPYGKGPIYNELTQKDKAFLKQCKDKQDLHHVPCFVPLELFDKVYLISIQARSRENELENVLRTTH